MESALYDGEVVMDIKVCYFVVTPGYLKWREDYHRHSNVRGLRFRRHLLKRAYRKFLHVPKDAEYYVLKLPKYRDVKRLTINQVRQGALEFIVDRYGELRMSHDV